MSILERRRDRAATAIPPEEAAPTAAGPDEAALAGEATGAGPLARLGALAVPDFRALWFGSLISNVGSWMQVIGSGWLVLRLTDSPFWLGVVSFAPALPILLFSLPAGMLADRVDRRRLLLGTQALAGMLALILALLTGFGVVRIGHILAITLLSGTVMAFHMPAWQTMLPDLVGKDRLMNAVGLNSAAFNGAAVVGPALAGGILGTFGVAACFAFNAVSYLAVIAALLLIRTRSAGHAAGRPRQPDGPGDGCPGGRGWGRPPRRPGHRHRCARPTPRRADRDHVKGIRTCHNRPMPAKNLLDSSDVYPIDGVGAYVTVSWLIIHPQPFRMETEGGQGRQRGTSQGCSSRTWWIIP